MRTIASLACKILGLYSIVQGLRGGGNVFSVVFIFPHQPLETARTITTVASFLLPILFGVLLWFLSGKLSMMMVKEDTHSNMEAETKASEIQRISFSVLGLYFIGNSLIKLVHFIVSVYPQTRLEYFLISFGSTSIELIIGLGIFFGSQGLVNLLNAVKNLGLRK